MGKYSGIEWTHHTFNAWWGCIEVSSGCDNCYAKTWARRVGQDVWGPHSARRFFSDDHWAQPLRWNKEATLLGERQRVFALSMGDLFEQRADLVAPRHRLFDLIEATPQLDWLLLSKRIHLARKLLRGRRLPSNAWMGTTIEAQPLVRKRLPALLEFEEASVRFVSCEPLLSKLDLRPYLARAPGRARIDWVIAGGESGGRLARPANPFHAEDLQQQCEETSTPFFWKQWGRWAPRDSATKVPARRVSVQSYSNGHRVIPLYAVGKTNGGRVLNDRTWEELPTAA